MNKPPSHLYSAAHFASDDVSMITFGTGHMTIFDPVIHFFKMVLPIRFGYQLQSHLIFLSHIYYL